jgi:hypothetical protein
MGMYVIVWLTNAEKGYLQMDIHAMMWLANTEIFVLHKRMTYAHGLRLL